MNDVAAFKGTYADWKLIKTRGCVQVIFELPLHEADAAYQALGGMPDPAKERWFGIARLSNVAGQPQQMPAAREMETFADANASISRPHKPVAPDKRLAQQAGIVCADPMFWRYVEYCHSVGGRFNLRCTSADEAAAYVRTHCQVASRSEIKVGTPEGEAWNELHGLFLLWRDVPELAPADHQGERV